MNFTKYERRYPQTKIKARRAYLRERGETFKDKDRMKSSGIDSRSGHMKWHAAKYQVANKRVRKYMGDIPRGSIYKKIGNNGAYL